MGEKTAAQIQSAIDRFNAGDPKALDQIFEWLVKRLTEMARRMLKNDRLHQREQTGDVVQEACIRLLGALRVVRVGTPGELFGLSATNMRRTLIDLARHHYGPEGSAANQANVPLGGSSSAPGVTPVETTNDPVKLAAWAEFHECVEGLPEDLRATFEQLYYNGLTQEQASQVLGVSVPTVRRRWRDAKLALFEKLGDSLPGDL